MAVSGLYKYCLVVGLFWGGNTYAQDPITIKNAIDQAVQTNPTVLAAWDTFITTEHGVRAARGRYLPRLDFDAERGRQKVTDPRDVEDTFDPELYRLTLTQMLFDGFATKNEVDRQKYTRLATFYDFRAAVEQTGLDTAQAYLDVLRFRSLLALAKENYVQHVIYHEDIRDRVVSGLGRGVDLEQAKARLALAESNVLTEATNLHDVSARYHRLVGDFPPEKMLNEELPAEPIPPNLPATLNKAYARSPILNSAIENIRVTRAEYRGRKSPFMPRLDLRLQKQVDKENRQLEGQFDEERIDLVLSYNLYNGGSDKASRKQSQYRMFAATDDRNRVCREVRQTTTIAYNDISSTALQVNLLTRNEDAISKARIAYKNQFDIGQRTLLDLLDTENEYFEVRRALTNAKFDNQIAYARTLASMGFLAYAFDIVGQDKEVEDKLNFKREADLDARCPADAPSMPSLDLDVQSILAKRDNKPIQLGVKEVMKLDVKFENGSANLTAGAWPEIRRAAKFLCENQDIKGTVEGHTDSVGSDKLNLDLSRSRASAVKEALEQECHNATGRLFYEGYGESRPIARNDTAVGRATNRRVVLVLETNDADVLDFEQDDKITPNPWSIKLDSPTLEN